MIYTFTDYDDTPVFCDSCGLGFTKDVFQCKRCEDYALCPLCWLKGMHKKHIKCFKQISFDTYKHILG